MEKRLEDGEVDLVIQAIPQENMKDLIKDKGGSDIRKLFGKAADDTVTISRAYLEEHAWLLQPFIDASPIHTLHIDSILGDVSN